MRFLNASLLLVASAFLTTPVAATAMDAHHHHGMGQARAGSETAATRAYKQAMVAMHQQMQQPASGNADVDFVRQMVPHHQAAVEMAKIQLAYGHNEALKSFSRWVITAQNQEIGYMQNWLRGHDNGKSSASATDYYGEAMKKMHEDMMVEYTGDPDEDFVRAMIPHHQGALDMASIWFTKGTNPELRPLVGDIYRAQTYEIDWQQHWLNRQGEVSGFPSFIF